MILRRQIDSIDCGSSCLAMIAQYYGIGVDIEQLRKGCSWGKGGVSMFGISKVAESIGLKTVGGRTSFESLTQDAPLPCIVHWNQNHFVVVYKIKKRKGLYSIYVADPGKGLVPTPRKNFVSIG